MFIDNAVTEMGFLDDYSDAAPQRKSMRGNCITTFLLHVAQCIIFNQTNRVKTTPIVKALMKSFYPRLCFKVIKDFANSPNFEEACKRFRYESVKSKADQKKTHWLTMFKNHHTTCYISS